MKLHLSVLALYALLLFSVAALAAQDFLNEEWVVPAGGVQAISFTVSEPTPIRVHMTPVKDADKGVTLRIVPEEDFDGCKGGGQARCRSRGDFDGFAVRSFNHTGIANPES
jgi:hypothetical protein